MKFTSEHIQQLLVEKITGTINPENDLVIEQLLTEDEEVFLQWQAIRYQMQQAEARGFSMEVDVEKSWQGIVPLIKKPRKAKVFSLAKISIAAATLAVIFSGVYLITKNKYSVPVVAERPAEKFINRITLSMDKGEMVYLKRDGTNTFQLGGATIKTTEGRLSYMAGKTRTTEWSTLSVPAIEDYKIVLSDGTEVWLNSETKIHFPLSFPGKTREVDLEGEAFFKVAKNPHQPFIVHSHKSAIQVLGTEFNVNTYDGDKIKTALVAGAVAISANNNKVNLKPGDEAIYGSAQRGFAVEAFDESEVLSWMKGVYYFHNTPLTDLSKLLSRWYNVEVRFENSSLMGKTFSGMILKNQPVQFFLDNIKISNQVNTVLKDGVVYFK